MVAAIKMKSLRDIWFLPFESFAANGATLNPIAL
jgi:hypothetical protein